MKLYEFEGADLMEKYRIPVPKRQLISSLKENISIPFPLVVKAQVLSGDRKKAGGIIFVDKPTALASALKNLLGKKISNEKVEKILIEEKVKAVAEYYVSFSFSGALRAPVLAISSKGGSGISDAFTFQINMIAGLESFFVRQALSEAKFPSKDINPVSEIIMNLWKLFTEEKVVLAEINPLLKTSSGSFFACDAKVDYGKRRSVESMDGDIAVIASGGGASLINIDALLLAGGRPANYAEYSGNPKKEIVEKMTQEVLAKPGIKACWVVGGTASFTDIYETMNGFLEGLKKISPKPDFPFVIRRDGPRTKEAQKLLADFAKKEGYKFFIFGSETPMVETAQTVVDLAYGKKPLKAKK
ncbi:MAG TPA: ATP-grasp domain-containing protein [Candidatus Paceibacterota bacterium]